MAIGVDPLVTAINCNLSTGGLDNHCLAQLANAADLLKNAVVSVSTCSSLPAASCNTGRLIYTRDTKCYYYSDGTNWSQCHCSAYTNFSDIWQWGSDVCGALGDGTTVDKSSPVSVIGGFTNWTQISANPAGLGSAALRTDGTAWAWGSGLCGRLGNSSTVNVSSPVSVLGSVTNWCQISSGCQHTVALRADGTLWSWGGGQSGQLGDNSSVAKSSPIAVTGGVVTWSQVSAGVCHTVALKADGTAWAWGLNVCGRLGDCTVVAKSSPVAVIGGVNTFTAISAGCLHTLALRADGKVLAWGTNLCGLLGDNTTVCKSSPAVVTGTCSNWCAVSAGYCHSAALQTDGTAWTWGSGICGRQGNNLVTSSSSPVAVSGGVTNWCAISAGSGHTVALKSDGTAWAWGCGTCGALGDGTTVCKSSPVSVIGGFTNWSQVSAGSNVTAGVRLRYARGF